MDQDNRRRAKEILIGTPVGSAYHETREASRDEILSRVKIVGVEKAAQEFRIRTKVIKRWLEKEGMTMKKDKEKTTPEEHVAASQNPEPQPIKKSEDFSPEERKAIVARAKKIGTQKAADEAGTTRFVVMSWERNDPDYKKFAGRTPAEGTPVESMSTEIIPGSDGLPPRKEHVQDYSIEDRLLLIAKADEVGSGSVSRAYGLSSYTIPNWKRPLTEGRGQIAAPRKSAVKKQTSEKQTAEKKSAEKKQTAGKPRKQATLATPIAILASTSSEEPAVSVTPILQEPAASTVPAEPIHTVAPADLATPITPLEEQLPQANPVDPTPAPAIPAVSVTPDTIEMIRLKDRVMSLEERVEKLRKVILDLI